MVRSYVKIIVEVFNLRWTALDSVSQFAILIVIVVITKGVAVTVLLSILTSGLKYYKHNSVMEDES